jgi:hypothetical protein
MNTIHIPGYTNETHLQDLADTISSLRPNSRILEIGCAYGRSTCCILDHLTPGSTLTTVDTFAHIKVSKMYKSNHKKYQRMGVKMPKELAHNLEMLKQKGHRGFYDWITQQHPNHTQHSTHEMTSVEYMKMYHMEQYDCVYLDGDHTYDTVSKELAHYELSTVLCGDDWGPAHPGVTQAVNELRQRCETRVWQEPKLHLRSGFWSLTKTA